jgi:hypothetical protein
MKRLVLLWLTLFLILPGAAVAADTVLQQPWIDRGYVNNNDAFKSLLVIGVPDHPDERRQLEDKMAKALAKSGVQATASLDIMAADTQVNKENILAALEGKSIDGVLLTRVFRVDDVDVVQGVDANTMRIQRDFDTKLWDNYDGMRGQAANIKKNTKQRLVLENNLYGLKSESLVWTVQSSSMNPESSDKVIKSLSKLVSEQLRKDDLI